MIDRNGKFFIGVTLRGPYAAVLAQPEKDGGILAVAGFVDELSLPAVGEWCREQLQRYAGTRYRAIANHGDDVGFRGYYDDVGEELTQPLADKLTGACRIFWQKPFESTRKSRRAEVHLLLREGMQGEGATRLGFEKGKAQPLLRR